MSIVPQSRSMRSIVRVLAGASLLVACERGGVHDNPGDGNSDGTPAIDAALPPPTADAGDQPAPPDAAPPTDPLVDQLLARLQGCADKLGGGYSTDDGEPSNIDVCGLKGAVYWKADLDVDCDGERTAKCNEQTDGSFQNQTS